MDPGLPGKMDMGVCTLSSLVIQMCVCEAPGLPGDLDVAVWTPGSLVIMDMGVDPVKNTEASCLLCPFL